MQAAEAFSNTNTAPFDLNALFDGLAGSARVAIAVSGGSDSMALLRLAAAWGKVKLVGLTVDHGLRAESAVEAQIVSGWCRDLGIEHQILTWQGAKPSTGIQAKARAARYDLMTDYCAVEGISVLLTAHTQDDQAETVAMRAKRTNSPAALAGIWPEVHWNGLRVVRPLLGLRRQALRDWLRRIGQSWIDDPSNDDARFERVRVRRALVDSEIEPLAQQAMLARGKTVKLNQAVADWMALHVTRHVEGHLTVALAHVTSLPLNLRQLVLGLLAKRAGGGRALDHAELDRLYVRISTGETATLGGAIFVPRRGTLWVAREAGRIAPRWSTFDDCGSMLWDGRCHIKGPSGTMVGPALLARGLARPKTLPSFVFQGMPVVRFSDGTAVPASAATDEGVSVEWN